MKTTIRNLLYTALGDELAVRLNFFRFHHYFPDLQNPQTFNEKIAWRKLYDRDARLKLYVDKIAVKSLVAELIGEQYIIPTLATYDSAASASLDFPMPFVVKTNHGSSTNLFVRSESEKLGAIEKLARYLRIDYTKQAQEWAYGIKPRLLIEPMILINGSPPNDFKFHVFRGKTFFIQVDTGRFTNHRRSFYSPEWEEQNFTYIYPKADPIAPPAALSDMLKFAKVIGGQFSYARVDFYDGPYFGEVTFYPEAGYGRFSPSIWDTTFGQQWNIE